MSSTPTYAPQPSSGSGVKTALVAGALVALVASNIYLYFALDHTRTDLANLRASTETEIGKLQEASTVVTAAQRRNVEALKGELAQARQQINVTAGHAKQEAQAHADQLAKQLADVQTKQKAEFDSQIHDVQQSADTKFGAVTTDVTSVKTDLGSTKAELDKTIANLNKVTGDLGVQSGYVATNAKELAALKRLGERNYFEFNLGKSKQPQRVGDITVLFKKADPKHNRYSIDVLADDKKYEKKDKSANEPVQFYVAKARQPYELVVNEIKKDQLVGYLSTPKDTTPRN